MKKIMDKLDNIISAIKEKKEENLDKKVDGMETPEKVLEIAMEKAEQFLTAEEEVKCAGKRKRRPKKYVILTNKRIIILSPTFFGLLGNTMTDYRWLNIKKIHINEKAMSAIFEIITTNNEKIKINWLPKNQARKLYNIGQETEEEMIKLRRKRKLEEKRAEGGRVVVQSQDQSSAGSNANNDEENIEDKLTKLKELYDSDIIEEEEYKEKKEKLLEKF